MRRGRAAAQNAKRAHGSLERNMSRPCKLIPSAFLLLYLTALCLLAVGPFELFGSERDSLAGTHWRLVEIQSMDDATGTARPSDPDAYTMDLNADGTVAMRLDCNRARGTWTVMPVANGSEGGFLFGPVAVTRAQCPPPSLGARIAKDMPFVRSFLLKEGRLYLSLFADGGIYVWEPPKR